MKKQSINKIVIKTEKFCSVCKVSSEETKLYFCIKHKNFFCVECLNEGPAVPYNKVLARCHNRYYNPVFYNQRYFSENKDDCIMLPVCNESEVNKQK